MKVTNMKLEFLFNSLRDMSGDKSIGTKEAFQLAGLATACENAIKPFFEVRIKKTMERTHINDTGERVFENAEQTEAFKKDIEELYAMEVELPYDSFTLNLPKDSKIFNINISKSFMDVFGDKLIINELEETV